MVRVAFKITALCLQIWGTVGLLGQLNLWAISQGRYTNTLYYSLYREKDAIEAYPGFRGR